MMTSSALVLFHDAARAGAVLRRPGAPQDVLSVLAQCLGCAGLVTILWLAVATASRFAPGSPILEA